MAHAPFAKFERTLFCAAPLVAAACGSVVVENQGPPGSGGGGSATTTTTTTTGAGGATTTSVTSTTSGAGGLPTFLCGGKTGAVCPPEMWCQFDPMSPCGNFDATGVCQPKPDGCDTDCPGVCGCDGKVYCNACNAQQAGVDVDPLASCLAPPDTYRAINMFTGVPRFVWVKASPSRNLCFRLVAMPGEPGIGISGDGWSVVSAEVTSDVLDCDFDPGWPPMPIGGSFISMTGAGFLSLQSTSNACIAGIHAKVDFAGAPGWAPPGEAFDADGLVVEGGTPGCSF